MSCFNKEHYKQLKQECEELGVHVYTESTKFSTDKYNGISVAFAPTLDIPEGRMIEVAVSFCSPEDEYKKKHGKYQAMLRYSLGGVIQLPLNEMLQDHGPEYTGSFLIGIFSLI